MKKQIFTISLIFLLFQSCLAQQKNDLEIKELLNISYLENPSAETDSLQQLNLVLPIGIENPPLLVWIGGGAWSYVNRHMEMDIARQLAKDGIAVAAVGHRLSPATWKDSTLNKGIQHPKHMEDIAAAFHWLHTHSKQYNYNNEKMFIGGFSSGAHLAALLGMDEKYLKKHGLSLANVKGMIPIGGAYDIKNYHEAFLNGSRPHWAELHVEAVFGNTDKDFREASPTAYIENMQVPLLLISENNTFNYAQIFEDSLRASDFRNFEVIHVHRMSHGGLWRNFGMEKSIYRDRMRDFIFEK